MIENLLKYQEVDKGLKAIENELMGSEERKKAVVAKKYLESVSENLSKLDLKAGELSANFKRNAEECNRLKEEADEMIKAAANPEDEGEAGFLLKKAEELFNRIKNLENDLDRIDEELKSVVAEYGKIRQTTKAAQAQYQENAAKYAAQKEAKKDDRAAIEKQLEEIKKTVDPHLMEIYEKKRGDKMYPIFYELKGNGCGYCHMEQSMAVLSKLKNGEVVECETCHRIIYQPEKK